MKKNVSLVSPVMKKSVPLVSPMAAVIRQEFVENFLSSNQRCLP
jgi:hypothetical protein